MTNWKQGIARNYNGHAIANDMSQTFADFVNHERKNISRFLARNVVGFVGQEAPTPVHTLSQRGQNFEVTYCGRDWQAQASASFALLYSLASKSFRPVVDLGVYDHEDDSLSKAQYHLGRWGTLRVVEYIPEDTDHQALANFLNVEPFEREADTYSHPLNDPVRNGGYIVGPREFSALVNVLHTKTKPKSFNKVYEIPGPVRKS